MRLTCPNCDAQYEVPDEVMPVEGRDVQCSACGCTWFQAHPDHPEAAQPAPEVEDDDDFAPDDAEDYADAADAGHLEPADEVREAGGDRHVPGAADDDEDAPEDDDHDTEPAAPRRVDPGVGGILREEAEREARLRAAEAGALESQPDLGLDSHPGDEAARRAVEADARKARMRGETPTPVQPGSRRGLLPDIDEINSTLGGRKQAQRTDLGPVRAEPEAEPPRRKGGFARGFIVALLLAVALALIYTNARQIAETMPQADPMLSAYVALVDQARVWLDARVGALAPQ